MTVNPVTATRISLVAALLLLAIVVYNLFQPAMTICGDLDPGYQPIIAFELARSVPDLHAIFGDAPGACREALIARFAFINMADDFLFIPLYGIFLFFFFLAVLNELAALGTNLTKIESRPVHGKPWEYIFYVDCQIQSPAEGSLALEALARHCAMVKELGRYQEASS